MLPHVQNFAKIFMWIFRFINVLLKFQLYSPNCEERKHLFHSSRFFQGPVSLISHFICPLKILISRRHFQYYFKKGNISFNQKSYAYFFFHIFKWFKLQKSRRETPLFEDMSLLLLFRGIFSLTKIAKTIRRQEFSILLSSWWIAMHFRTRYSILIKVNWKHKQCFAALLPELRLLVSAQYLYVVDRSTKIEREAIH